MKIEKLVIPDRFDRLRGVSDDALKTVILPVEESLAALDKRFRDIKSAQRGAMLIMRGAAGIGKSTFLETVRFFRHDVETVRIARTEDVDSALSALPEFDGPRIAVIEGREALGQVSEREIESWMHSINAFVRTDAGSRTLVVWPVNKVELGELLHRLGVDIGDDALFGIDDAFHDFRGLAPENFIEVAERTVSALNDGLSLTSIGVSEVDAADMVSKSKTIGQFLGRVRGTALGAQDQIVGLLPKESYRVWTVVIAGSDAEVDVAALTRGSLAYADIDRLVSSTNANVVEDLQAQPAVIGILGTTLDARIVSVDMVTILSATRTFGSPELHELMAAESMKTSKEPGAIDRIKDSELGRLLSDRGLGTRRRGSKPGDNTKQAFAKVAAIARQNDGLLNNALGQALVQAGLIDSFETEIDLGTSLTYKSDLYCLQGATPIRLEVMWRQKTSRAEIANYVLGKLRNYGRAIGLIK